MVILIIGGILFFLSSIVAILTTNIAMNRIALDAAYIGFFLLIGGMVYCAVTSARSESRSYTFPASEYELKMSITEYEGQRDTTYVLVKKPHSVSTNCKETKK